MKKIDYLGFEISPRGIEPGERKIMAVKHFSVPKDVRAVRGFIGRLASYFQIFVNNFAVIIRPLTDLLGKINGLSGKSCWLKKEI